MLRTERHIITKKHELYKQLDDLCWKSKNLYNQANYRIRQEFINNKKWLRYDELYDLLKNEECYTDLGMSRLGQQILRLLDKNWVAFFTIIKDWSKHKEKYKGRPKLPKYKNIENGRNICIFPSVREKYNYIILPKILGSYKLFSKLNGKAKQLRIIPRNSYYIIEIVKEIGYKDLQTDNNKYLSIDLGIDNLATMVNNIGLKPVIANGKGLKSINKYYNKKISYYKSTLEKMNHKKTSKRIDNLWLKRNNKINNYLHNTSRYIVNYCNNNNINTIIIGKNDGWKNNSNLGKVNNQTFVQIPFDRLIQQIQHKAEELGINVELIEESYTSGTSFLDGELPSKEYYNKSRRIKRGLFKTNTGKLINSDVNGSLQIMVKYLNVSSDDVVISLGKLSNIQEVLGLVANPVKVNF